jgi:hypothetical protein
MIEKLNVLKAEVMMKVAGFILQNHDNPVMNYVAKTAGWLNQKRYGNNALDFLENEESIDLMSDDKYESDNKNTPPAKRNLK